MRRGALAALPSGLLALAVMMLGLVAVIALELRGTALQPSSTPVPPEERQAAASPARGANDGTSELASRRVSTILARPLFSPGRRPDATAVDSAVGLARLTGVMVSATGKTAIFAGTSGGRPVVVGEGARIGAYVVGSIETGAVTIIGPEGERVLHPTFDPNPPPPPPPSPRAPAMVAPAQLPPVQLPPPGRPSAAR